MCYNECARKYTSIAVSVMCVVLISGAPFSVAAENDEADKWSHGDSWIIEVDEFDRDWFDRPGTLPPRGPLSVNRSYRLKVTLSEIASLGVWEVRFINSEQTSGLAKDITVEVDDKKETVLRVLVSGSEQPDMLEKLDEMSFIARAPRGLPIELFGTIRPGGLKVDGAVYSLSQRKVLREGSLVKITTIRSGPSEIEITQKWKNGSVWWDEYQRRLNGRVELRAKLIGKDDRPFETKLKKTLVTKSTQQSIASNHVNLCDDSRLQATITRNMNRPTVHDVLDLLQRSTNLSFSADVRLVNAVAFDSFNLRYIPACKVMGQIANSTAIEGGHWTAKDMGYHLDGKLIAIKPASARSEAILAHDYARQSPNNRRWWAVILNTGCVTLSITGFIVWRLRNQK